MPLERLDWVAIWVSSSYYWWVFVTAILVLGLIPRFRWVFVVGLVALTAIAITDVTCGQFIKPLVARDRPCADRPPDLRMVAECGGRYGFPSNHAANGMAVTAVLFTLGLKGWGAAILVMTLFVAFTRVYLGVHYPSDILAGFLIGGLFGWAAAQVFQRFVQAKLSTKWTRG